MLIGLLSITILIYLFQSSAFSIEETIKTLNSHGVVQDDGHTPAVSDKKKAFVTFLCDDIMVINMLIVFLVIIFIVLFFFKHRVKLLKF